MTRSREETLTTKPPRLCRCGCDQPVLRRPNESRARHAKRKYATPACWYRVARAVLPPRLCACGCGVLLVRRKREHACDFRKRLYATRACVKKGQTVQTKPKVCQECGAVFERRRRADGRLESSTNYDIRRFCSRPCADLDWSKRLRERNATPKPVPPPPKTSPKPLRAKRRIETPAVPSKAADSITAPREPTKLPNPKPQVWQTIMPSQPVESCPDHPVERAGSCTVCGLLRRSPSQKAKPRNATASWW